MNSSLKNKAVLYRGGACIACHYDRCDAAMEFHHVNPSEKSYSIANGPSDWELLKLELDKCILLCSNCHREYHAGMLDLTKYEPLSPEEGEVFLYEIEEYWDL